MAVRSLNGSCFLGRTLYANLAKFDKLGACNSFSKFLPVKELRQATDCESAGGSGEQRDVVDGFVKSGDSEDLSGVRDLQQTSHMQPGEGNGGLKNLRCEEEIAGQKRRSAEHGVVYGDQRVWDDHGSQWGVMLPLWQYGWDELGWPFYWMPFYGYSCWIPPWWVLCGWDWQQGHWEDEGGRGVEYGGWNVWRKPGGTVANACSLEASGPDHQPLAPSAPDVLDGACNLMGRSVKLNTSSVQVNSNLSVCEAHSAGLGGDAGTPSLEGDELFFREGDQVLGKEQSIVRQHQEGSLEKGGMLSDLDEAVDADIFGLDKFFEDGGLIDLSQRGSGVLECMGQQSEVEVECDLGRGDDGSSDMIGSRDACVAVVDYSYEEELAVLQRFQCPLVDLLFPPGFGGSLEKDFVLSSSKPSKEKEGNEQSKNQKGDFLEGDDQSVPPGFDGQILQDPDKACNSEEGSVEGEGGREVGDVTGVGFGPVEDDNYIIWLDKKTWGYDTKKAELDKISKMGEKEYKSAILKEAEESAEFDVDVASAIDLQFKNAKRLKAGFKGKFLEKKEEDIGKEKSFFSEKFFPVKKDKRSKIAASKDCKVVSSKSKSKSSQGKSLKSRSLVRKTKYVC